MELFIEEFAFPESSQLLSFECEHGEGDDHDGLAEGVEGEGVVAESISDPPDH
jgi:hypothetical protein